MDPFETTRLAGMTLKNRFVRSATWEGKADPDGRVTDELVEVYKDLAQGGVGLIIASHTTVLKEGQATAWQTGAFDDDLIPGLSRIAAAAHDMDTPIVLQISHGGLYTDPALTRKQPAAPFPLTDNREPEHRVLLEEDIAEIVAAFGQAARRAREAGFDGVQVHAAHGYLFSQFLSPIYNQRPDAYGGSVENRARALLEAVAAVRREAGEDFPVLVKMNGSDHREGGVEAGDAAKTARLLEQAGVSAIEVSGGLLTSPRKGPSRPGINKPSREAYFRGEAKIIRQNVDVPVILVGGVRSLETVRELLNDGTADYFSMARPLICEPGLINRWKSGDANPARCVSDNQCFNPAMKGLGLQCETFNNE